MKKNIARILCLIMLISVVLCGCSGEDEKAALVGTWSGTKDLGEALNASMDLEGTGMEEYFVFDSFELEFVFEFKEDGTYAMYVSDESADAAFAKLMDELKAGMTDYIADMLTEEGLDMTVEEFLELSGMSLDDLVAEAFSEDMIDEVVDAFAISGQYDAKDGKLYLSDSVDSPVEENVYDSYTISGSTLTITMTGAEEDELGQYISPLVLEKEN